MNNTDANENEGTKVIKFLKRYGILPENVGVEWEEIIVFPLLWSYFESEYSSNSSLRLKELEKIAKNELKGYLQNDRCFIFDGAWEHFQNRYAPNGEIDDERLDKLFPNGYEDGKKVLKAILKGNCRDTSDKMHALLIIIYRLRNNFFHGAKWEYDFKDQRENFCHANKVLMKLIALKKR